MSTLSIARLASIAAQLSAPAVAERALSTSAPTIATSKISWAAPLARPTKEECMSECDTETWKRSDWVMCMVRCHARKYNEDGLQQSRLPRDLSYAPSSTAHYAVSSPLAVTVTETWIHHDTICSATPLKSTHAVYALSTSKSIPASYAVKTSSQTPVYPTAPVYKPSSHSTPGYVASSSKTTPGYVATPSKSIPSYVASSSKSTPAAYAVSTSKSTPASYYVSTPKSTTTESHQVYPTGHYAQPTTSAKYEPSSPQSSSHESQAHPVYSPKVHSQPAYYPAPSQGSSIQTHPAGNETYNKPSASYNVPVPSETIISLGGASAYGVSVGAVVLAVAAMM